MALPYTDYIKQCYSINRHYVGNNADNIAEVLNNSITIENTTYNSLNLKIDISKDIIELPSYGVEDTAKIIKFNLDSMGTVQTVYYPIVDNSKWEHYRRRGNTPKEEYKSASPAIKAFFIDTYTKDGIRKIKIGNKSYYGGRGILFTEDMKPLLLMTMQIQKKLLVFKDTLNSYKYEPVRPIIRVHPDVYKVDFPLEKHIRTKLIPEAIMLDGPLHRDTYLYNRNGIFINDATMPWKFKIIIDDFEDCFDKPTLPTIHSTSEDINKFLSDNIENILETL